MLIIYVPQIKKQNAVPVIEYRKDLEDAVLVMLKQHIQNILHLKRVLEFIGTVPFQEINMKKLQDRLEKKSRRKNAVRSYG